ncbi:hypothetical protein [Streptomyces scabiei]|uniref:hypothetical protein n=1 Tax=Streptomyces scabiei TaxID=1930 RepID=UPI00131A7A4D|nr:hypothetical protein [Streptomyces scabiei]
MDAEPGGGAVREAVLDPVVGELGEVLRVVGLNRYSPDRHRRLAGEHAQAWAEPDPLYACPPLGRFGSLEGNCRRCDLDEGGGVVTFLGDSLSRKNLASYQTLDTMQQVDTLLIVRLASLR